MKLKFAIGFGLLLMVVTISCQNDSSIEFSRYYSGGSIVYQTHCKNCHGAHGEGLGGLIPPLTDSTFLKNNLHQLPCIIQNGVNGKITISNKTFEGQMPATGLAPIEIAQAITFIGNSFGNKLGTITADNVGVNLEVCK
jgi:mono/diheme cytochrome c family protein